MRLFHFSDDPTIEIFSPRPVRTPSARAHGREWLNGPLVWSVDEWHQPMYLFPRDCPRILVWPTERTTEEDRRTFWGSHHTRMIAFIERGWFETLCGAMLFRYELPQAQFESLDDAGMWVCRFEVRPVGRDGFDDLNSALRREDVELRLMDSLLPLRQLWNTSLHVSGIRLRHAVGWPRSGD